MATIDIQSILILDKILNLQSLMYKKLFYGTIEGQRSSFFPA